MIRVCADCKKELGHKHPKKDKRHTHTYCHPCKKEREAKTKLAKVVFTHHLHPKVIRKVS